MAEEKKGVAVVGVHMTRIAAGVSLCAPLAGAWFFWSRAAGQTAAIIQTGMTCDMGISAAKGRGAAVATAQTASTRSPQQTSTAPSSASSPLPSGPSPEDETPFSEIGPGQWRTEQRSWFESTMEVQA